MIIKLHQNLINKIAAGEVVERPASVLKELIENSIDAKATKITINIENAGTKLIEVIDNGTGMNKDDAVIACDSHSTSKITTMQDLEDIHSMGFRGEALASISAVSAVTLETKSKKNQVGTLVTIDNGKKVKIEEISTTNGTKISVKNLFDNIPARKKFLKSHSTEYKHILVIFYNYALAFPNIHFILSHNNKLIHNLPANIKDNFNKELKTRINDLFGDKISSKLVPIFYDAPRLQIFGFAGHPSIARSHRSYQLIFLNKRPITDRLISKAVYDSYQGLMPKGKYPIFFIFLNIDPLQVDVNVHPRKSEVRFENPQQIFKAVKQASNQSLLKFLQKDSAKALEEYSHFNKTVPNFDFKQKTAGKTISHKSSAYKPQQLLDKRTKQQKISQSIKFTEELLKTHDKSTPFAIYTTPRAFQVLNEFIIIEKDNCLQIIDQHAAAERVTYERLKEQLTKNKVETQKLLIPETIELNKIEFQLLNENRKNLSNLGIHISIFGKSAFKVEEIPALIAKTNIKELISDIVAELNDEIALKKPKSFENIQDHLIATLACHSSIRGGMKLQHEEINDLVNNLLKCKNPYSCPHGRPIMWKISKHDLEKKFERP